jgi:hypothetical protein
VNKLNDLPCYHSSSKGKYLDACFCKKLSGLKLDALAREGISLPDLTVKRSLWDKPCVHGTGSMVVLRRKNEV